MACLGSPGIACPDNGSAGFTNIGADADQEWWVCATCHRPTAAWLASRGDFMLNYFRGGRMDGTAYETTVLLSPAAGTLPIAEYKWTPEMITSQVTGQTARVWVHTSLANQEPETASTPAQPTQEEVHDMAGATRKKATGSVVDRRKALKLSRQQFADAAGVNVSQLYKLEHNEDGTGVKPETVEAVTAKLDELEKAAATPGN